MGKEKKRDRSEEKKIYYQKNRKHLLEYGKEYYYLAKAKVLELLGKECVVCGREENIRYHEIHGKKHAPNPYYIAKHHEDFIPMCRRCHDLLHYLYQLEEEGVKDKLFQLLKKLGDDKRWGVDVK